MAESQTVELPVAEPLPPSHAEVSKSIFNKAMADAKAPADQPAPELPAEPVPAEKPKGAVPDDVISPHAAEPEKPNEAIAAIDAMQLPKSAKPEQVTNFHTLKEKAKKEIETQAGKIKELEEKIGQSSDKGEKDAWQAKITAAEEKAAKIEEDFSKVAFEQSPRFRAKYVERERTAIDGAKSYLEGTDFKPEIIDIAAQVTGKKRLEILQNAGIEGDTLAVIVPYLANFDAIQRDKKAALDNWKGESARWQEEHNSRAQAEKAKRADEENRVWETVIRKTDLLPLRKSKDDADWNARAEGLLEKSKQIFNGEGVPLDAFAETIQKGVAYDAVNDVLQQMIDENKNLKAENAKLKSARPGGTMTTTGGEGAPTTPVKQSRDEQAKSTFNTELAKARGS